MPLTVPDVTVCVIGSSLRQVTFVPTCTVRSGGMNASDFNEITVPPVVLSDEPFDPDELLHPATTKTAIAAMAQMK